MVFAVLRKVIVLKIECFLVIFIGVSSVIFTRKTPLMRPLGARVRVESVVTRKSQENAKRRTSRELRTHVHAVPVGRMCTRCERYMRKIPHIREKRVNIAGTIRCRRPVHAANVDTFPPGEPGWRTPADCQLKKARGEGGGRKTSSYFWHKPPTQKGQKRREGRINGLRSVTRTRDVPSELQTSTGDAEGFGLEKQAVAKERRETERKEFQGEGAPMVLGRLINYA